MDGFDWQLSVFLFEGTPFWLKKKRRTENNTFSQLPFEKKEEKTKQETPVCTPSEVQSSRRRSALRWARSSPRRAERQRRPCRPCRPGRPCRPRRPCRPSCSSWPGRNGLWQPSKFFQAPFVTWTQANTAECVCVCVVFCVCVCVVCVCCVGLGFRVYVVLFFMAKPGRTHVTQLHKQKRAARHPFRSSTSPEMNTTPPPNLQLSSTNSISTNLRTLILPIPDVFPREAQQDRIKLFSI